MNKEGNGVQLEREKKKSEAMLKRGKKTKGKRDRE